MSPLVFIQAGGLHGEANSVMGALAVARAALMNGTRYLRSWAMEKWARAVSPGVSS